MNWKDPIRGITKQFGYELRNMNPPPSAPPPPELPAEDRPLSIDVFDLAVKDLMSRVPEVVFAQVGAHDGKTYDPIHAYISKYGWRGVLVEPQPRMFAQLSANYAGNSRVVLQNCAITKTDGENDLFVFAENQGLPEHATMLASFTRDYILNNSHGYKGEIVALKVPTLTPKTLLTKSGLKHINLLQIDTEGHDFVILMEFLNAGIFPDLVHFESAFIVGGDRDEYLRTFARNGYRVLTLGIDTIAYRQPGEEGFKERASMSRLP